MALAARHSTVQVHLPSTVLLSKQSSTLFSLELTAMLLSWYRHALKSACLQLRLFGWSIVFLGSVLIFMPWRIFVHWLPSQILSCLHLLLLYFYLFVILWLRHMHHMTGQVATWDWACGGCCQGVRPVFSVHSWPFSVTFKSMAAFANLPRLWEKCTFPGSCPARTLKYWVNRSLSHFSPF